MVRDHARNTINYLDETNVFSNVQCIELTTLQRVIDGLFGFLKNAVPVSTHDLEPRVKSFDSYSTLATRSDAFIFSNFPSVFRRFFS